MVNPETGQKSLTQVKTGIVTIDKDQYKHYEQRIFLFQSNDLYSGAGSKNVEIIPKAEVLSFLNNSLFWLPKSFQNKVDLLKS